MKLFLSIILCSAALFAAPVTVTFDSPVPGKQGVLHTQAVVRYVYIDSEHLDVYTSVGTVRMCYPDTSTATAPPDSSEFSPPAKRCDVEFIPAEMTAPAAVFIKTIIPAHVKGWFQNRSSP